MSELDDVVKDLEKAETKINSTKKPVPKEEEVEEKVDIKANNVTPAKMAKRLNNKPKTIPELLREFVNQTRTVYVENEGTPYVKYFATYPAWSYLIKLHKCHVDFADMHTKEDPIDKNAVCVIAKGVLLNAENEAICHAIMTASSTEDFLKNKPLAAVYGLAQTRVVERLAKTAFASDLTLARLEPTGAEELDIDPEKYGTKGEEV